MEVKPEIVQATFEFLGRSPAQTASRLYLTWEQLIIEYNKAAVEANKEVADDEAGIVDNE